MTITSLKAAGKDSMANNCVLISYSHLIIDYSIFLIDILFSVWTRRVKTEQTSWDLHFAGEEIIEVHRQQYL